MEAGLYASESAEMYLKSIWELADSHHPLPIAELAGRLGISAVSATEMVHRMEQRDLLEHTPYRGVQLTDHGQARALAIVRRHRLWEAWLYQELGLPWADVHDLACSLEHAAPNLVADALATRLGHPSVCPHGNPIPGSGSSPDLGLPLSGMQPGRAARLQRVHPESGLLLHSLDRLGLRPGVRLQLQSIDPLDGLMLLSTPDSQLTIGATMAAHLFITVSEAAN